MSSKKGAASSGLVAVQDKSPGEVIEVLPLPTIRASSNEL
jgi:hypothetical protein